MARGRGASTGRGNYPAAQFKGTSGMLKEGIKGAPKVKNPNRHLTTNEYKIGLRKVEEGSEE